jgi:hypothetical protein
MQLIELVRNEMENSVLAFVTDEGNGRPKDGGRGAALSIARNKIAAKQKCRRGPR